MEKYRTWRGAGKFVGIKTWTHYQQHDNLNISWYIMYFYHITLQHCICGRLFRGPQKSMHTWFPSNAWKLIEVCSHARQFDISIYSRGGWSQPVQAVHTIAGCVWLIRLTEFNHRVSWISRTKHGKKRFTSLLCVYWKMYITSHLKWINKKSCARSEILFFPPNTHDEIHIINCIGTFIIWIFKL